MKLIGWIVTLILPVSLLALGDSGAMLQEKQQDISAFDGRYLGTPNVMSGVALRCHKFDSSDQ